MAFILTLLHGLLRAKKVKVVGGWRFRCGWDDWILGGEYTGQDVVGEAERANLPQLFTGNGSGGWHIDSGSDTGADSSDGPCISSI